ncbi:MAG: SprB repeat-containing protein [Lewinellaceae bacterium]|nr:SprB repeat-containing protein [Lewinellaceae bacterium]
MNKQFLFLLLLSGFAGFLPAQKTAYIPLYLLNPNNTDGAQFTWSKTQQSANFTLIWGNTVGTNPANYPDPNLAFNPAAILDTMEFLYAAFKGFGFLDDSAGTNLSQYKIPIVVYGTWGPNGAQGFANGGDADGVIGAFWVHPNALHDGGVAAHELTHSLQAQAIIDYRTAHGLGPVWNNAGIFWESHANFMRNLMYPKAVSAWGMDVYHTETWGDWKNTYENYELLFAIMESEGIEMVNRLWRESWSTEYPLQAYKRLAGYNQAQFNDSLYLYARRMATFDFNYSNIGNYFRQYRNDDLMYYLPSAQATFSILKKVPGEDHRYEIPIETAPEEFAYNVIPLYPENDSCAVIIKFKGHTEANAHAGWRYGFVAAHPNGTLSRYSPIYADNTREIIFTLQGDENKLFLVVMGAPFDQITTNTTNDTWHGYPKHFRNPYELSISGAVPEGFQAPANFRSQLKFNGHLHSNGGGWVQNTATVASSVFVGPSAMVLGNANISEQVRIENTALVKDAVMSGQVRILNNAFVNGGNYSGNAVVQGQGFAENVTMSNNATISMRAKVTNYNLSGTVDVGGDVVVYNENGSCNNGVYYRLTNYYDNKLLECDGRTANHPVNADVNNTYSLFSNEAMAALCQCSYETTPIQMDSMSIQGVSCTDASAGSVAFHISKSCGPFQYAWSNGGQSGTNLSGLTVGNYNFSITDALGREVVFPIEIPAAPVLTASVSAINYNCSNSTGGVASITLTNGAMPAAYLWDNGETEASIQDAAPGLYTVTATDAQGCTFSGSVQVELSGQLNTALSTSPISCHDSFDGSAVVIPLNGTAPFAWLWQNGITDSLITNLDAGDYALTILDAFGCFDQQSFSLTNPLPLSLEPTAQPVSCFGAANGMASVAVSGGTTGYSFFWNNQEISDTLSNLPSGGYSVTVTDDNGCSAEAMVLVDSPTPITLQINAAPILCAGMEGTSIVAASGGVPDYTYQWSSGETGNEMTSLAGTYIITVTDAHGCTTVQNVDIPEASEVFVQTSIQAASSALANDGAVLVTAVSGGVAPYAFLWSNGATTPSLENLPAGNYTLSITDAAGCVWTFQQTIGTITGVQNPGVSGPKAQIVPNPSETNTHLWLELPQAQQLDIRIWDAFGRVQYEKSEFLQAGKSELTLPEGLVPGAYWVSIRDLAGNSKVLRWWVM